MKAKVNSERLVMQSVMGRIHHPTMNNIPYRVDTTTGLPRVLPGTGAITYNVKIGDSVYAMECDHVEPGVSIKNADARENNALNALSCIGNKATVITGDAKGATGFVTGTHGGIDHVLLYFPSQDLERMAIGDKIQILAQGQGMKIEGFEDTIAVMNTSPELFNAMDVQVDSGKLIVPVAASVPAYLMGSGVGSSAYLGDYDIMTADHAEIVRLGLDRLRYGDIVALQNCDNIYGRGYLGGAITIGVVVHSDCILAGHGPGVTALMSCRASVLEPIIDLRANIAELLIK